MKLTDQEFAAMFNSCENHDQVIKKTGLSGAGVWYRVSRIRKAGIIELKRMRSGRPRSKKIENPEYVARFIEVTNACNDRIEAAAKLGMAPGTFSTQASRIRKTHPELKNFWASRYEGPPLPEPLPSQRTLSFFDLGAQGEKKAYPKATSAWRGHDHSGPIQIGRQIWTWEQVQTVHQFLYSRDFDEKPPKWWPDIRTSTRWLISFRSYADWEIIIRDELRGRAARVKNEYPKT